MRRNNPYLRAPSYIVHQTQTLLQTSCRGWWNARGAILRFQEWCSDIEQTRKRPTERSGTVEDEGDVPKFRLPSSWPLVKVRRHQEDPGLVIRVLLWDDDHLVDPGLNTAGPRLADESCCKDQKLSEVDILAVNAPQTLDRKPRQLQRW